jgi:hypothetical protein
MAQGFIAKIDDPAHGIPRRRRAEERQDVIVALTEPVDMHGLAEIRSSASGSPMAVAGSKRPPMPMVELIAKRSVFCAASPMRSCSRSFTTYPGWFRLEAKLRTPCRTGAGITGSIDHRRPAPRAPGPANVEPVHGAVLEFACVFDRVAGGSVAGPQAATPRRADSAGGPK